MDIAAILQSVKVYSSLYQFFLTDEEGAGAGARIITNAIRRSGIKYEWEADCRQAILLKWLDTTYDIRKPRREILSFAAGAARIAIQEWRRSVILATYVNKLQRPEPVSVYIDELHGEDKDRFVDATTSWDTDPANHFVEEPQTPALSLSDIQIPPDTPSRKFSEQYKQILEMLSTGLDQEEVAEELGISSRTIRRRLQDLRKYNENITRRSLLREGDDDA